MIVSIIRVVLAMFAALTIGNISGRYSTADIREFLDKPGGLPLWLIGSGVTVGLLAAASLFVILYALVLRKSELGSGKLALIFMMTGAFGAVTGVLTHSLPAHQMVLSAAISREASAQDIESFAKRANQPDLITPLWFEKPADVAAAAGKAKILQGMIVERQNRLNSRNTETLAAIAHRAKGKRNLVKGARALTKIYIQDDKLFARYWTLWLTYYQQVEQAGETLAAHPDDWRLEKGQLVFARPGAAQAWKTRMNRLNAVGDEARRLVKAINQAGSKPRRLN